MKNATIEIGTHVTMITEEIKGHSVKTGKMGDFARFLNGLKNVVLTGTAKPSKLQKYQSILIENGFSFVATEWNESAGFEGANSDVIKFRIKYTA
jgi:hypothetical protein